MGRQMFLLSTLFICLVTLVPSQSPEALSFTATVDRTRAFVSDQITLTLSVIGEGLGTVPEPELPPLNDFTVVGRNSSSPTQISFANGNLTATKTLNFIYILQPNRVGSFIIEAASIRYEGETYATNPIPVKVIPEGTTPGRRAGAVPQEAPASPEVAELEANLFLEVSADRKQAYVGEQVTLIYKLYSRYQLRNVQYGKALTYTGFWAEAMFDAQKLDFRREVRGGRVFNAAILKRIALFPTSSGKKTLDQMEIGCDIPVRTRRRSLLFDFDDFDIFGRVQRVTVRSEPLTIQVKPLPPGAPAGFRGAVGEYSMRVSATPKSVVEGDPISVKLTVSGTGNLETVRETERPKPRDFKIYDPKVSKSIQKTGDRIGGSKIFEYVVIPKRAGSIALPRFEFVSFNPRKREYVSSSPAPIRISVSPRKWSPEEDGNFRLAREEVTQVGRDIRHIKADAGDLEDQSRALYQSWVFLSVQTLPFLAVAATLFYRRRQERIRGDVAYARRRRSKGEAARRLKAARKNLNDGEGPAFHAEVYRALSQFLADRLNIPAAGLTGETVSEYMLEKRVDAELVALVRDIFERCDFARFSPAMVQDGEMDRVYQETEAVIEALERKI